MDYSMPPPVSRAPPSSYTAPSPSPSTSTIAAKPKKPRKPKLNEDGTPVAKVPKKRPAGPKTDKPAGRGGKGGSSRAGSVIPSRAGSASVHGAGGAFSRAGSLLRGTDAGSVASRSRYAGSSRGGDDDDESDEAPVKDESEEEDLEDEDEMAGDEQVLWKRQNEKVKQDDEGLRERKGLLYTFLNDEQKQRSELVSSTVLKQASISTLCTKVIGQRSNPGNILALQGIGKVYIGEIVEIALQVAKEYGQKPPLTPAHLREAQRRYQARLTDGLGRAPGGAGAGGTFGGGGGLIKKRGPFGGC